MKRLGTGSDYDLWRWISIVVVVGLAITMFLDELDKLSRRSEQQRTQEHAISTTSPSRPSRPSRPCPIARIFIGSIPDRRGTWFTWGMPLDSEGRLIAYLDCPELVDPQWTSLGAAGCYILYNDEPDQIQLQPWSVQVGGPSGAHCRIRVDAAGLSAEKEIEVGIERRHR